MPNAPSPASGCRHGRTRGGPKEATDLESAWNELHDAKPAGWFVGQPVHIERRGWEQYAFDTRERANYGHRSRDWTDAAATELEVVREMARCLALIGAGEVPT